MSRDSIRAATLGRARQVKSRIIETEDTQVEVRQPSIKARSNIFRRAKVQSGDRDRMDMGELQITAVIECCFVPGTVERVFSEADRESLENAPAGSFVDELSSAVLELLNVDAEDLAKNSVGTPNDSSSSR